MMWKKNIYNGWTSNMVFGASNSELSKWEGRVQSKSFSLFKFTTPELIINNFLPNQLKEIRISIISAVKQLIEILR